MLSTRVCKLLKNAPNKIARRKSLGWDDSEQQRRRLLAFVKSIQVTGIGLTTGAVSMKNEFIMNVDTYDYEDLTFELTCTSTNDCTTVALEHELIEWESYIKIVYKVDHPGRYRLDIKYQGMHIPFSPFKLEIRQQIANARDVVAFGKGLQRCMAGSLARFYVNLRKSGYGRISVTASSRNSNSDVPIIFSVTESKYGYGVQYIASTPGYFFFHIKLNGKHIPGSPFLVNSDEKEGLVEKAKLLFRPMKNAQYDESRLNI